MARQIHRQRTAMATLFEVWLVGEDEEHLIAVANAAFDEIQRIERLLSRFDSVAEIYRINQEAIHRPILIDFELFDILKDCKHRYEQTEGYFNVCRSVIANGLSINLDEEQRTVQLSSSESLLDLGGYGKGYALDAAAQMIVEHGVTIGFLHGGTSSALALDSVDENTPWKVGISNPFSKNDLEATQVNLTNQGLSSSVALEDEQSTSDVINPIDSHPLSQQAGCTVLAPTALDAEVLSTALLAMGKARAMEYLQRQYDCLPHPCSVCWQEEQSGTTLHHWLQGDSQ